MPARPQPPSASCTTPVSTTRLVRCTTAQPPWTGWNRNRSAASPSPLRPRPRSGKTTSSISSTRQGMWISPSRWSAICACSTARSRFSTAKRVSNRSPNRCGGRPTNTMSPNLLRQQDGQDRCGLLLLGSHDGERLGANAVPIQLPVGAEADFEGVVDLVEMNAKVWRGETKLGETYDTVEIPADLAEQAEVPDQAARGGRRVRRAPVGEVPGR